MLCSDLVVARSRTPLSMTTNVSALGQEDVFEIRAEGITHRLAIGMRSYTLNPPRG